MFPMNDDADVEIFSLNLLWPPTTSAWPILAGHHETTWSAFKNTNISSPTKHEKPHKLLPSFGHTFQLRAVLP
jgi:hypothetical protein